MASIFERMGYVRAADGGSDILRTNRADSNARRMDASGRAKDQSLREAPVETRSTPPGPRGATEAAPRKTFRTEKALIGEVGGSKDLDRILALPRRKRPSAERLQELAHELKARLGIPNDNCRCVSQYKRICCADLLPIQAWALSEVQHGVLGAIGVGHGKTLYNLLIAMLLPDAKNVLLLLPPSLKPQLLQQDIPFYSQHWKLPNVAGATWHYPDRPTLHVMSYSALSSAKHTATLPDLNLDTVIMDEAHNVAGKSVRADRYNTFMRKNEKIRAFPSSGTLTKRELPDWAQLAAHALKDGSPVPRYYPTVTEWGQFNSPVAKKHLGPGQLMRLCEPGEDAVAGLQRRIVETYGVIATSDNARCEASLTIKSLYPTVPPEILKCYEGIESAWERPDGEQFVDALSMHRALREISCGFFYRWKWPRREPPEVIKRWLEARKLWRQELREKLKYPKPHMDSPLLLAKAAIRWYKGYIHVERDDAGHVVRRDSIPPFTERGPLPVWPAASWPEWAAVRKSAQPETEPVWVSPFLIDSVEQWHLESGKSKPSIIWYTSDALGRALAQRLNLTLYGPGNDASSAILKETGRRSIVASIRSHGTGKNLQQFSSNLIVEPPSDGAIWEQLLGRCHRFGQLADEVTFDVFQHTPIFQNGLVRAKELGQYIQDTFGSDQKLVKVANYIEE